MGYFICERPIKVALEDGREVYVKLNISAINMGANSAVLKDNMLGKLSNAPITRG